MRVETRETVRIMGAERWYGDPGFLKWLNAPTTATWHVSGTPPDEMSDVFTYVCDCDGSDRPGVDGAPSIPVHIWEELLEIVRKEAHPGAEVLVWISK